MQEAAAWHRSFMVSRKLCRTSSLVLCGIPSQRAFERRCSRVSMTTLAFLFSRRMFLSTYSCFQNSEEGWSASPLRCFLPISASPCRELRGQRTLALGGIQGHPGEWGCRYGWGPLVCEQSQSTEGFGLHWVQSQLCHLTSCVTVTGCLTSLSLHLICEKWVTIEWSGD